MSVLFSVAEGAGGMAGVAGSGCAKLTLVEAAIKTLTMFFTVTPPCPIRRDIF
jgi:uncharacterized membrane protein YedE/YeeE